MKVALAYNVIDSVSGENTFFDNLSHALESRGMEVARVPVPQGRPSSLTGRLEYYSRFPTIPNAHAALKPYQHYDVLHMMNAALAPAAGPLRNKVKVATTHFTAASYLSHSPPANPLARAAEALYSACVSAVDSPAFRSLDMLVACSPYQRNHLIRSYSLAPERVAYIPPGIDSSYFERIPKADLHTRFGCEKAILFLGRLHERSKGLSYMIRAMGHLAPGVKLLVVGDGPDAGKYRELVRREKLGGRVEFLGRLDFYTKSVLHKSADMVAMPSLYEVYGTVFAESAACGVPVAAFDLPFWKGLYEGAGLFVKPRDHAALAEAAESILGDDALRSRLAARAARIADGHDLGRSVDAYVRLYESLSGR